MAEPPPGPLRILLVDPLAGAGIVVKAALEAAGHRVAFVHDWPTAENRLALYPFDAVVMCVTTSGRGRRGAAALLRGGPPRSAALPLIGLVPGGDHRASHRALAEGYDATVARPVDARILEATLRRVIAERAPPLLLDADRRAALRDRHGPAALAALDAEAMERAARLLLPLLTGDSTAAAIAAAAAELAATMERIGASHAAAVAREMAAQAELGRRAVHPLMGALTATRTALRHDRLTAARRDPIWAASDTSSGDAP